MAETKEQRQQRHSNMGGVRVTLPDGRELETDVDGRPVRFSPLPADDADE